MRSGVPSDILRSDVMHTNKPTSPLPDRRETYINPARMLPKIYKDKKVDDHHYRHHDPDDAERKDTLVHGMNGVAKRESEAQGYTLPHRNRRNSTLLWLYLLSSLFHFWIYYCLFFHCIIIRACNFTTSSSQRRCQSFFTFSKEKWTLTSHQVLES